MTRQAGRRSAVRVHRGVRGRRSCRANRGRHRSWTAESTVDGGVAVDAPPCGGQTVQGVAVEGLLSVGRDRVISARASHSPVPGAVFTAQAPELASPRAGRVRLGHGCAFRARIRKWAPVPHADSMDDRRRRLTRVWRVVEWQLGESAFCCSSERAGRRNRVAEALPGAGNTGAVSRLMVANAGVGRRWHYCQ